MSRPKHSIGLWVYASFAALSLSTGTGAYADPPVTPRTLRSDLPSVQAPSDPDVPMPPTPAALPDLTLRDALALALQGSPSLQSASWETRSREARVLQAGLRPNPSASIEGEDFAGSGERRSFDSNETTISIAQLVELGQKRLRRTQLAEAETALAAWDYEARRVAVLADTTRAFLRVLNGQERIALAHTLEELSAESLRSVESTVRAGAVSPIEIDRATVNLERVQLEAVRATKSLDEARILLSAAWGATESTFSRAIGNLQDVPAPPSLADLLPGVAESPEVARWQAEIQAREAAIALERARSVPDVLAALGTRYYNDSSDLGVVAAVSVPIPIFDRNQGNVLDARYRRARAVSDRRAAEVSVRSSVEAAHLGLEASYREVQSLRDQIIPRATRVFEETRSGYATGLFRYLEVLDAQRTLFDARRELLDALANYHIVATEIEKLTGLSILEARETSRPGNP